jgi:hypothetical protein
VSTRNPDGSYTIRMSYGKGVVREEPYLRIDEDGRVTLVGVTQEEFDRLVPLVREEMERLEKEGK